MPERSAGTEGKSIFTVDEREAASTGVRFRKLGRRSFGLPVQLYRNGLTDANCREARRFHRRFQTIIALALDGHQRSAG